ncbi:MAG: type II secretion system protein GspN [Myxococcales bacterium]|nr:type II secretion system protein GspN [Myxococcales bacterium]
MFDLKRFNLARLISRSGTVGLMVAFGAVVYAVALVVVFPYERVGEFAEATASTLGYDVEIGETGPTFGVGVKLDEIRVRTRPRAGSKPVSFLIETARVTTSPLKNLTGGLAYDFEAEVFGGQLAVSVEADSKQGEGKVNVQGLDLAQLPGIKESFGIPLAGKVSADVALVLPKLKAAEADGTVQIQCAGCSAGDGKAKLRVDSNPLLAEGLTIPRLRLGDLEGRIVFEKGTGRIEGMHAKSPDAEIDVEGTVRLADPADLSQLDLYVTFKLSDKLVKSDDKFQLLLQLAEMQGKRPDGFYGFRIQGSPRHLRDPQWSKTSPFPPRSRTPKPNAG